MNRSYKLSLAIALALGSSAASGLGLGTIEVRSGLNEPLVAEIPVIESSVGEAGGLKANLASIEDFTRVGLDVSGITVPLEFSLEKGKDGHSFIRVTSTDPVKEPFMSFLVEVSWSKGRLLREYNVLLDPPSIAPAIIGTKTVVETIAEAPPVASQPLEPAIEQPVEPVAEAPALAPLEPAVEPTPEPEPEPIAEAPVSTPPEYEAPIEQTEPLAPVESEPVAEAPVESAPTESTEPAPSAPGEYGPVASGETLWEIASSTRPEAVSLNQMMVAILRANPDGFFKDNVNALKRGAVLRIPSGDEVRNLAAAEAAAEIAAQNEAWVSSRAPTLVADSGYSDSGSPRSSSSGSDRSRLELVPPRSGDDSATGAADRPGASGGTDNSAAVRSELARSKEQLASREEEAKELRSRVTELESLKGQSDRLITMKDSEIAELQRRLQDADAAVEREQRNAAAAQAAATAAVTAATTSPIPMATLEPLPEPSPVATIEPTPIPVEPTPEPIAATPTPDSSATPDDGTVASTDGTGTEPTPTETETDDGATVTAVPEPTPVTTAPATTDEAPPPMPFYRNTKLMAGAAAAVVGVVGLLALLLGRRKKAVAPVTERGSVADQFAGGVFGGGASGTGDQENQLLERLASDPTDLDTHLDLLRMHYTNSDAEKFEAAASAMYAQIGDPTVPQWQQAVDMGRDLLPGNPLFEDQVEGASRSDGEEFSFDALEPTPTPAAGASGKSGDTGLFDFDLGRQSSPLASTPVTDKTEKFDFSLQADAPRKAADAMKFDVKVDKPQLQPVVTEQFKAPNFDLGKPAAPKPTPPAPAPAPAPAAPGVAPNDGFFEGEDAVGTKLDLARAYLDMGDPEGARSMLQEVMAEGNDSQKGEARKLLLEIG